MPMGESALLPNLEKGSQQDFALDLEGLGGISSNLSAPQISSGEGGAIWYR